MTEPNEAAETPVAAATRIYRDMRAKQEAPDDARVAAHNEAVKIIHAKGLPRDEHARAVREMDDALGALARPEMVEEAVRRSERLLDGPAAITQDDARRARETAEDLRGDGHASAADRVEIALYRAALRAVVALSNEAPVRQLAMVARGM